MYTKDDYIAVFDSGVGGISVLRQLRKLMPQERFLYFGDTANALAEVGAKAIDKLVFGMDVTDPATAAVLPASADEIELVGLVSNICVVSNAVVLQSRYPEATIIVDAACTDSFDKALHEKVLDVLEGFQVKVTNR